MDQTEQDRLTTLAETYRQKSFRLQKSEADEAATLLTRTLSEGESGAQVAVKFFRSLPPESTAKAVHDAWPALTDDSKGQLLNGILDLPRTDRFDRLKLIIAAEVTKRDPVQGAAFLCRTCASLDSKSGGHTSADIIQWFRKWFLSDIDCQLEKLDITPHPGAVTAPLLGLALHSLSLSATGSPYIVPTLQVKVVKWLFRNQAYPRLKASQQTQLVEAIKRWPTAVQVEFHATLDNLPAGFEFLLAPSQKTDPTLQAQPVLTTKFQSTIPDADTAAAKRGWKDILAELQKQMTELDEASAATKEQLAVSQETLTKLQDSAKLAEIHVQEITEELGKKAIELEQTVVALSAARAASADSARRTESLELEISVTKKKNQEQIDLLNSRIETEAAHHVESFKHAVARVLRVDYTDFKNNDTKPMTLELGQGLSHLLASIFDNLQRNGINVKE